MRLALAPKVPVVEEVVDVVSIKHCSKIKPDKK